MAESNSSDPSGINPFGAAGLSAVGDFASSAFSNYLNRRNSKSQRKWLENMSNTAYQRARADMEKAGLNPALMYGGASPASTPNSPLPNVEMPRNIGSSAMSVAAQAAQYKQIKSDANWRTRVNKFKEKFAANPIGAAMLAFPKTFTAASAAGLYGIKQFLQRNHSTVTETYDAGKGYKYSSTSRMRGTPKFGAVIPPGAMESAKAIANAVSSKARQYYSKPKKKYVDRDSWMYKKK